MKTFPSAANSRWVDLYQMFMKSVFAIRVLSRRGEDAPGVFPLKKMLFLAAVR